MDMDVDTPRDVGVGSATRRSSSVAPRACVRRVCVCAGVLVCHRIFAHIYIVNQSIQGSHRATHGHGEATSPSTATHRGQQILRHEVMQALGGCKRVATALACAIRLFSTPFTVACNKLLKTTTAPGVSSHWEEKLPGHVVSPCIYIYIYTHTVACNKLRKTTTSSGISSHGQEKMPGHVVSPYNHYHMIDGL